MTLAAEYTHSATIYLRQLKTPAPDKGVRVPPLTLSLLARTDEVMAFMPMNINGSHWTCLLIDRTTRSIYGYHSLAKLAYHNLLEEIEGDLVKRSLPQPYQIVSVHCPIQKDGDNCGVFHLPVLLASGVQGSGK
ncbi:hypothetical protein JG688_00001499 [Phytophthora aleatoria]|uniref:Ubiquitin-like protease family profile domain-containing protein n=1 Tax=Phytophthora aleatoria TaxID=2496075 RepID=A0A8J5IXL8_9STRA|nr:hypothetical protein JG688_00001499 [Phytophthora aleatoria]